MARYIDADYERETMKAIKHEITENILPIPPAMFNCSYDCKSGEITIVRDDINGNMSVKDLDRLFGTKWRIEETEEGATE